MKKNFFPWFTGLIAFVYLISLSLTPLQIIQVFTKIEQFIHFPSTWEIFLFVYEVKERELPPTQRKHWIRSPPYLKHRSWSLGQSKYLVKDSKLTVKGYLWSWSPVFLFGMESEPTLVPALVPWFNNPLPSISGRSSLYQSRSDRGYFEWNCLYCVSLSSSLGCFG